MNRPDVSHQHLPVNRSNDTSHSVSHPGVGGKGPPPLRLLRNPRRLRFPLTAGNR